jgi:hypothetical protein
MLLDVWRINAESCRQSIPYKHAITLGRFRGMPLVYGDGVWRCDLTSSGGS